jgi:hypothetical protein
MQLEGEKRAIANAALVGGRLASIRKACNCERQRASSQPVCLVKRLAASARVAGWRKRANRAKSPGTNQKGARWQASGGIGHMPRNAGYRWPAARSCW